MIPANALAASLQAYVKTPDLPLIQVVDAIQEIQQLFTVGEQVRATVTSQLPTGRFTVLVKDQMLDLNLPRNTEPGDELEMQVLANSPRLTFLLPRQPPVNPVLPQPLPPGRDSSTEVDLSATARFVGAMVAELAEQGDQPASATLLSRTVPLMASGNMPAEPAKLADQLKQALTQGGLFYESHLAEWVTGGRTLEQILSEPPARGFGPPASEAEARAKSASLADQGARESAATEKRGAMLSLPESVRDGDEASQVTGRELLAQGKTSELDLLPPAARQQVQQQLQLLDQRQIVWQGEAWPGQPLKWEVEEDDRRRDQTDTAAPNRVWRTRLELELPHLGQVEAIITLHDQTQVEVGFVVRSAETASRIRTEQSRLQMQMEAAGLALNAHQVIVTDKQS
ncbi:flagellar hook-length control protein FliK [Chitinimonas sp. BJYL2]|uniref:flagellar hook-length control protein FliK n=1 Tax=Chitinimonas sp. BJYL2 TaxID=2976696 RepID=UPI0022B4F5E4|nr:flagellar hook-length control protein FliK [Chitinimonas sp. BJYL2]